MDEVKIRTPFIRGIISKLLSKLIKKKLGREVDLKITQITLKNYENGIKLDVALTAETSKDELSKIVADLGL